MSFPNLAESGHTGHFVTRKEYCRNYSFFQTSRYNIDKYYFELNMCISWRYICIELGLLTAPFCRNWISRRLHYQRSNWQLTLTLIHFRFNCYKCLRAEFPSKSEWMILELQTDILTYTQLCLYNVINKTTSHLLYNLHITNAGQPIPLFIN